MKKISAIKAAITYAEAMYEGAEKSGQTDEMYTNANLIKSALDEGAEGFDALNNPLYKFAQKEQVLDYLAQKLHLCSTLLNTLKILAQNNELNILYQVLNQFILIYQQKHNIAEVEITTVVPLNSAQEHILKDKLTTIFNKQIKLRYIINPQIIGGLIIKYGTNFIDNSVKHKLDALEQLMKGTK